MFDKIVILGLGGVGSLVAAMLRDLGADILGVDVHDDIMPPDGVPLEAFLGTATGRLYAENHPTLESWHAGD